MSHRRFEINKSFQALSDDIDDRFYKRYSIQQLHDYFTGRRTISPAVEIHLAHALEVHIDYFRFINGKLPDIQYSKYPPESEVLDLLSNIVRVYTAK